MFQSTLLTRVETGEIFEQTVIEWVFQSTLPTRVETSPFEIVMNLYDVSIHSTDEGRDVPTVGSFRIGKVVSIHSTDKGRDYDTGF